MIRVLEIDHAGRVPVVQPGGANLAITKAVELDASFAFEVDRALIFQGITQINGYAEPALHRFGLTAKEARQ